MAETYSAADVAKMTGVARSTVYSWKRRKKLCGIKVGGKLKFKKTDLAKFVFNQLSAEA